MTVADGIPAGSSRGRTELVGAAVETLLAGAPVGYAVLDRSLRYVLVNDYLAAINGRTPEEHLGRTLQEVVPDLADSATAALGHVLETGEPLRELELTGEVPSSPGVRRTWTESVYPVRDDEGAVTGLAVVVFEVTSRVEVERARREALAMLDLLIMQAPIGIAFLDEELRYVRINETLAEVNGLPVADHLGRRVDEVLPEVAPGVVPLLRGVLDTGEPLIGIELDTGPTPAQPGRPRHWRVSYYPVVSGGSTGVGLIVTDETDRIEAERERQGLLEAERAAAARLRLLQQLTAGLSAARSVDDVGRITVEVAAPVLGASAATLAEMEQPSAARLLAASGLPSELMELGRVVDVAESEVLSEMLATGAPVLVTSRAERDRRFTGYVGSGVRQEAWANLPLRSQGRDVGVVAFGWDAPHVFGTEEVDLLVAIADQCATALDRTRLVDAEHRARTAAEAAQRRLDLLARAGSVLGRTLDEEAVLEELAALLVPEHADRATVCVPDGRGSLTSVVATARARSTRPGRGLGETARGPAAVAHRTLRTVVDDGAAAEAAEGRGPETCLAVPMIARGRCRAVLVLEVAPERRTALLEDRGLIEDVASRAAVALLNARLHGQRTRVATRLQESLLPRELPVIPCVDLAVRYATAEEAVEVGGDFYDAFALGEHSHLLVIGDVAGRGVDAAGVTGLARHTLRAVAHDLGPAEALQRLSKVVLAQGHPERFLTAACARLTCRDDGTGDLVLARGGHPTPLLVRADGTPVALAPAGSLLGAVADIRLDTVQEQIRPGDFLVLVTDGITEARAGTDLFGEERLATTLGEAVARRRAHGIPDRAAGGTAADWLADLVLEAVDHFRDGPAEDDVAILVAHVREAP